MKNITFLFLIIFSLKISAQDSLAMMPIKYGIGSVIGSETWVKNDSKDFGFGIGITFKVFKPLTSKISFSPDMAAYFPLCREVEGTQKTKSNSQYYEIGGNIQLDVFSNLYNRGYFIIGPAYSYSSISIFTEDRRGEICFKNNAQVSM